MCPQTDKAKPFSGKRTFHGRRKGKPLRAGKQKLLAELFPELEIKISGPAKDAGDFVALAPQSLFKEKKEDVWLEIGFGGGEHLAAQAQAHGEVGIIGCEPFINGVAALMRKIDCADLTNIRVYGDDARDLLGALEDRCLGRVFILFPDPWPKTRHHKRRLVEPVLLDQLSRVMKEGAELRLATDDPGYLRWILFHVLRHGDFEWTARRADDWRQRPSDSPQTRYESKGLKAGRPPVFLTFRRRS